MKKIILVKHSYRAIFYIIIFSIIIVSIIMNESIAKNKEKIKLLKPKYDSEVSIEKALHNRRSIRDYTNDPLTFAEVSQLLWAAQGITGRGGYRTAPSAGALYPLDIYVAIGNVDSIPEGIYKYNPRGHELIRIASGDKRANLCAAALDQSCVKYCAVAFIISAVYGRTTKKYMDRGIRYVHIEVGHVAQNIHLQAVSLMLGSVSIGAFYDDRIRKVLNMSEREMPLCIIPIGRK